MLVWILVAIVIVVLVISVAIVVVALGSVVDDMISVRNMIVFVLIFELSSDPCQLIFTMDEFICRADFVGVFVISWRWPCLCPLGRSPSW